MKRRRTPISWQRSHDWKSTLHRRDKRTPEEFNELRETIERVTGQTPGISRGLTAAAWVDRYQDGVGIALRTARRIRQHRDLVSGIDPATGLDDFDMNAEQRADLQRRYDAGQVKFKELPKSQATGERWLEDGVTAVGTWRDSNLRVDPRSRYHFNRRSGISPARLHARQWHSVRWQRSELRPGDAGAVLNSHGACSCCAGRDG